MKMTNKKASRYVSLAQIEATELKYYKALGSQMLVVYINNMNIIVALMCSNIWLTTGRVSYARCGWLALHYTDIKY